MSWETDRAALIGSRECSQAVARDWLKSDAYRALREALATPDEGDVDGMVALARDLLADAGWAERLLDPLIAALVRDPAFEPPFRIHRDPLRVGAVLYEDRRVSITATVLSADALAEAPSPRTVVVPGRVSVIRYHRAESATLHRWRTDTVALPFEAKAAPPCVAQPPVVLADGEVRLLDGRREGAIVTAAARDVVTLTVQLRFGAAPIMREYAINGGALLRAATLDEAASRTHMLLTLLRLCGRSDAGACFEAATHDAGFDLRWAAMREWLALDAAGALPRLRAMAANDDHAEVRAAACATLPAVEVLLCPA